MNRKPSIIMSFQARTKERIRELKESVRAAETYQSAIEQETTKVITHAEKEIARLEKSLPAKRKYKKRAKKTEDEPTAHSKSEAKRLTAQTGKTVRPRVTGTFGTGPLLSASAAPTGQNGAEKTTA